MWVCPPCRVAKQAADGLKRFLANGAAADEHLADELLLPMALGAGGRLRIGAPSSHAATNLELLPDWSFAFERDEASGIVELR